MELFEPNISLFNDVKRATYGFQIRIGVKTVCPAKNSPESTK